MIFGWLKSFAIFWYALVFRTYSPMVRETGVQSLVESYQRLKKCNLMPLCLALSTIRRGSRVKWSNPGNGITPSPKPRCSSNWKGSLRVTFDYGRQQLVSRDRSSPSSTKVSARVDSIVVVGSLTRCALLHSVCDLKAAPMTLETYALRIRIRP